MNNLPCLACAVTICCFALASRCHATDVDPDRHRKQVTGLSFLPNGDAEVSAGFEASIKVRDPGTGKCLKTIQSEHGSILQLAVSPDSRQLASANWDGTVALWDASTWVQSSVLSNHRMPALCVVFSPDGVHLASSGRDRRILLWDVHTKTAQRELKGHTAWVESLAFSADGTKLASGDWDGIIRIWDTASGKELASIRAHDDAVLTLAFSPDGKLLVSGAQDGDPLKFWNTDTWQKVEPRVPAESFKSQGMIQSVRTVLFLSDGELLTGSTDRKIRVWDVRTRTVSAEWAAHERGWVTRLALSPDHQILASGDLTGEVKTWKLSEMARTSSAHETTNEKKDGEVER